MLPKEIIKKIRQIEIYTRGVVNNVFAGQYESTFKGRGMMFDEVRQYNIGDDIRTIDWNVTARTGTAHIKRFVEERELTVLFAVDISSSGNFGTIGRMKNELAAEFSAVLSFAALQNNDKVGLLLFTDKIEHYIPPKKGRGHMLRLIRDLLYHKKQGGGTDILMALDYVGKVLKKKATVFLVSDFFTNQDLKKELSLVSKHHDIIAVRISDIMEKQLGNVGLVEFEDAESGQRFLVDTSSRKYREQYYQTDITARQNIENMFKSIGIDFMNISTEKDYINDIVKFFHKRHKRN